MKNYAAAELNGTRCRVVGVRPNTAGATVVAHHDCELDEEAVATLRKFRHDSELEQQLRIAVWPLPQDPGVTPVGSPASLSLPIPTVLSIRDRVAPLVRAGFVVTGVSMPHQALAELALQHGARLAIVAAFHPDGGCFTLAHLGQSGPRTAYVHWEADWCLATAGSGDSRARSQFASAIVRHLNELTDGLPVSGVRVLACGSMPNLRTAMAPFSEELGREVEVLDHPWPGMLDAEAGTIPTEPAVWQVALAAAQSSALTNSR